MLPPVCPVPGPAARMWCGRVVLVAIVWRRGWRFVVQLVCCVLRCASRTGAGATELELGPEPEPEACCRVVNARVVVTVARWANQL